MARHAPRDPVVTRAAAAHAIRSLADIAPLHRGPPPAAAEGGEATHFCTRVAPEPYDIRRVLLALRSSLGPEVAGDLIGRAELVVAEILNNIAEHGALPSPSRALTRDRRGVHLSIAPSGDGLVCIISDAGIAVPAHCLAPRGLPQGMDGPGSLPEGGFGWFMIQTMTEQLYYGRDGDRNVLAVLIPGAAPTVAA